MFYFVGVFCSSWVCLVTRPNMLFLFSDLVRELKFKVLLSKSKKIYLIEY